MVGRKWLALPLLAFALAACASFPYRWYVIDPDTGMLKGQKPKDDLRMSEVCKPDAIDKAKCIGMLQAEFDRLMSDYVEMRERLKACEDSL